jgi:hypothetical protein
MHRAWYSSWLHNASGKLAVFVLLLAAHTKGQVTCAARTYLQRAEGLHLLMVEQRLVGWDVHDAPEALKLPQVKALAVRGGQAEQVGVDARAGATSLSM